MKVVLIQPPIEDYYLTRIRMTPLNLLYLGGALKEKGFEPVLIDCTYPQKRKNISPPNQFNYLKKYYQSGDASPFKMFTSYFHFGMDDETLLQEIKASNAEVFCISASMTTYLRDTIRVANLIKSTNYEAKIIVGGSHATLAPETLIKHKSIDYVISGEGEKTLVTLLENLRDKKHEEIIKIKGLSLNTIKGTIINPPEAAIQDINTLPTPAFELLNNNFYELEGRRIMPFLFSKGCPHSCQYCGIPILYKHYRVRDPQKLIKEMRTCHDTYGIKVFDFEDDNLTFNKKEALELFMGISKAFSKEDDIELRAMNGITASSLDSDLLIAMKNAYFKTINLALITSDINYQKELNRPFTTDYFREIVEIASKLDFEIVAYLIIGLPDQTLEEMKTTFKYLNALPVKIGVSIYYPILNTKTYRTCVEKKLIEADDFIKFRSSALPIETQNFSRKDLFTFLMAARIANSDKIQTSAKNLLELFQKDKKLYSIINSKYVEAPVNHKLLGELLSM